MKDLTKKFIICILVIGLISSIQFYKTQNSAIQNNVIDENEKIEDNQEDLTNIGFDLEKVEYSPPTPGLFDVNESIFENNFDYVSHSMISGTFKELNGVGLNWSGDFDDDDILELVIGDNVPFTIEFIGHYYTMEAKMVLVSNSVFTKSNDPGIGGEISWKWDVNSNEQGLLANMYYSYGSMKVISGSGYTIDSYYAGNLIGIYGQGDPAARRGTTEIANFDSIIDDDGKIRLEVHVHARGFVDWWWIFTKFVHAEIEVHGLTVRQDLVPQFVYENNFDYSHYQILEGDYRYLVGESSAWSENPFDSNAMSLAIQDLNPTLQGLDRWIYHEKVKLHLVSHNTFTKLYDSSKDGTISWRWNVDEHGYGNNYNLYYSTGSFEISSGPGHRVVDTYTKGSTGNYAADGDPETRLGAAVVTDFDSIIDPDGKVRVTITVDAYGKVDWFIVEDKMVYITVEVYGLAVKQNVRITHQHDDNFDYEDSEFTPGSNERGLNGVGTDWSEDPFDGKKLEYVVGDASPSTVDYDVLFSMGGTLYVKSHETYKKQKESSFSGIVSWTYDIVGHEIGATASLYYSYGGLYILRSTGEAVSLDNWLKGSDLVYEGDGDPDTRTGTVTLDNFDQYIWDDGHLHFYLTCEARGWVSWWGIENKDVYVDLELWGLSVTREIHPPDNTPPEIYIIYALGDETDGAPGVWFVSAIDEQSGINHSAIQVYIDDVFVGSSLGGYPVPNSLGEHTIRVELMNNHPVNPLLAIAEDTREIVDDDTTNPTINIEYWGSGTDGLPGYFNWSINDSDDGIGGDYDVELSEITIIASYNSTDGSDNYTTFLAPELNGTWILDSNLGTYKLEIYARDGDDDRSLISDSLTTYITEIQGIADDDIQPPEISISYEGGDGTDGNPGYFEWNISDLQSGVGQLSITIRYKSSEGLDNYTIVFHNQSSGTWNIPSSLGEYSITIMAHDADLDRGFKDTSINLASLNQEIIDDDNDIPVVINLEAVANFDFVNITFTATDFSGIGNIELYVDGTLIEANYTEINGDDFFFSISNQWLSNNDTHDILVTVFDADNDRINDSISVSETTTFSYSGETTTEVTSVAFPIILTLLTNSMLIMFIIKRKNSIG
jgi:hypothetical protein